MNPTTGKPPARALLTPGVSGALAAASTVPVTAAATFHRRAFALGPLTLASHGLPYHRGRCATPGIANRDSAAEPTIVSDPRRPNRLLAAWFAAPDYDGLDHAGIVNLLSRSDDAGRHWHLLPARGTSACIGGREPKDADAAVDWARDGRSYFVGNPGHLANGIPTTKLAVFRFDPAGRRASRPLVVPAPVGYNNRPTVTADPAHPARLYVIWVLHRPDSRDQVLLATSRDRGQRWSVRTIHIAQGTGLWGTQIFPAGGHRLVVTYRNITRVGRWRIEALRSRDGGQTWSTPTLVGTVTPGVIHASGINTAMGSPSSPRPGPKAP